eukprot:5432349-Lingulodinium_polyedra.AAC.1
MEAAGNADSPLDADLSARARAAALKAQGHWTAWGLAEHGRRITCEFRGEGEVLPGERPSHAPARF